MPGPKRDNKQEIEKARIRRRRRFLIVLMPLILLFECGLVWNVGYLLYERFPMTGAVIMFLGLLGFSCIAILSAMQYLRRTKVRVALFLAIFIIGCIANFFCGISDAVQNLDGSGALTRVFISYCAAVAEFFPSRGGYDTPTGDYAWTKILFYYLSCVFSISIVIAIWGGKITNRWRLFLLRFLRQKRNVFWCDVPSRKEFLLAQDIYQNSIDEHCIFSAEEAHVESASELQYDMNYHGHLLCLRKPMQFHRVCLGATRHFFITDDYYWNIRMANQLFEKYRSIPHKKLDFYIRISDDVRKAWAELWAESIQKKANIDIHLINEATLLARILTGQNPLLKSPKVRVDDKAGKANGKFNILLLGFGEVGKAILRETVCDGQFLQNGSDGRIPFSVDIVDRDEAAFDLYGAYFEDAMKEYNVRFIRQDVCTSDFYRRLEPKLPLYNRIIIAFSDDTLNLETASRIKTIARRNDIVFGNSAHASARMMIRISDGITAKVLRDPTQNSQIEDVFFGVLDECYCRDVIINETLDRRAKIINGNHIAQMHPDLAVDPDKEWRRVTMFEREKARSCASGMNNLLLLTGMDETTFDPVKWNALISDEKLLNALAETEHMRWCAFLMMRGIRKWPLSEVGVDARKPNDIKHMRHAALTDFRNLPDVDRRFNRDPDYLQNNNRKLVQSVPDVITTK
jgi:hypothetical protein